MLKNIDFVNTTNVKVVDDILTDSIKMNASKIQFNRCEGGLRVDFIINNKPVEYTIVLDVDKRSATARHLIIRIKIMAGLNIVETNEVQKGQIKTNINGININQNVVIKPTAKGEEMVIANL